MIEALEQFHKELGECIKSLKNKEPVLIDMTFKVINYVHRIDRDEKRINRIAIHTLRPAQRPGGDLVWEIQGQDIDSGVIVSGWGELQR